MKKTAIIFTVVLLLFGVAFAASNLNSAYEKAIKEAGRATATIVEGIDLSEFADHFSLSLDEDDETLIRIALLAYSNGALSEHPIGANPIINTVYSLSSGSIVKEQYVGNKNSKKFHYSWCSSVSDMKESNKKIFNSRDDAIKAGYTPCKKCNP